MTKSELDGEINRVIDTVREFDAASDLAFSRGDVIRGIKYSRWASMALVRAAELAQRAARFRLATH